MDGILAGVEAFPRRLDRIAAWQALSFR